MPYLNPSSVYCSGLRDRPEQRLCVSAFVDVFCQVSILASAYRRAQYQQWHLTLLAVSGYSLCEPLICQPLAGNAVNKAVEPRHGMVLDVAFVQPEGELIEVAAKVLRAGVMIDANDPAFQHGPIQTRCCWC